MMYIPRGGRPFAVEDAPAAMVYPEHPPQVYMVDMHVDDQNGQLEEELDVPPKKEVIPGFVR